MDQKREKQLKKMKKNIIVSLKKATFVFLIIQLIILLLFFWIFMETRQVPLEKCEKQTIFVYDAEDHMNSGKGFNILPSGFHLYTKEGNDYQFAREWTNYSDDQLIQKLEGTTLDVVVYEESILAARNEEEVFYTFHNYSQKMKKDRIGAWVLFGVIELIFLSVVIFEVLKINMGRELLSYKKLKKEHNIKKLSKDKKDQLLK